MNKSIIVFCPNPYSLLTTSVCELLIRKGYSIDTIVVRKFGLKRFKNEFGLHGMLLIQKIWDKLVMKEKNLSLDKDNILSFRKKQNITVSHVKEFKQYGTKIIHCQSLNDKVVEDLLRAREDKIVLFTGGGIIRKNILEVAGDGIINFHMGVLPRYRGMDLPEWCVLENNTDELGITLHFMDTGIDTGEILKVVKIPMKDSENIKILRDTFYPVMVTSMVGVLEEYLTGKIQAQAQPESAKQQYFMVHPKLHRIIDIKINNSLTNTRI